MRNLLISNWYLLPTALTLVLHFSFFEELALGQRATQPSKGEPKFVPLELDGVPPWLKTHKFPQTKFTFVRIQYKGIGLRNANWMTDYPDADLHLSAQLGQISKLDVSQPNIVLKITDQELRNYPFAYISEPGYLTVNDLEVKALRDYLNSGGFLMLDDSHGDVELTNIAGVLAKVFPDRKMRELPIEHPVFHCVFEIKEKPEVKSIHAFHRNANVPLTAQFFGIENDEGRLMVIVCHNTDLADGWERAGEDETYTREMSKAKAFPMGINIIFYALNQKQSK